MAEHDSNQKNKQTALIAALALFALAAVVWALAEYAHVSDIGPWPLRLTTIGLWLRWAGMAALIVWAVRRRSLTAPRPRPRAAPAWPAVSVGRTTAAAAPPRCWRLRRERHG